MEHGMNKELPRPLLRMMRLTLDNNQCTACGISYDLTLHHIVPRQKRGKDTLENTVIKCRKCHNQIHTKKDNFIKRKQKKLKEIKALLTMEELHPEQDIEALILFFLWIVLITEQNLELILAHPYSKHVRSWQV